MLRARLAAGVKVNTLSVTSAVTAPATATLSGAVTVKVVAFRVDGVIASVNVAAMTVFGHTPAEPLGGVTEIGGAAGTQVDAPVVNVQV